MRENSSSVERLMQKGLEEVVGLDSGIGPAVHEVVLALMPLAVGSLLRARRRLQNTSPAPRRASLTPKTGEQGERNTRPRSPLAGFPRRGGPHAAEMSVPGCLGPRSVREHSLRPARYSRLGGTLST